MHKGLLPASYNDWKYSGIVNNNAGYVQCKKCMESKKCLNHNRIRKGFIREKTFTKLLDLGYQVFFEEADQVFKQ